jgi:hypothetical protein
MGNNAVISGVSSQESPDTFCGSVTEMNWGIEGSCRSLLLLSRAESGSG